MQSSIYHMLLQWLLGPEAFIVYFKGGKVHQIFLLEQRAGGGRGHPANMPYTEYVCNGFRINQPWFILSRTLRHSLLLNFFLWSLSFPVVCLHINLFKIVYFWLIWFNNIQRSKYSLYMYVFISIKTWSYTNCIGFIKNSWQSW